MRTQKAAKVSGNEVVEVVQKQSDPFIEGSRSVRDSLLDSMEDVGVHGPCLL